MKRRTTFLLSIVLLVVHAAMVQSDNLSGKIVDETGTHSCIVIKGTANRTVGRQAAMQLLFVAQIIELLIPN